jgi:excisionase family DNA binding protein
MDERLETPKQLATRVGVTERKIRHLIRTRQIEHVWIGSRVHIPMGAFARFVEERKVEPCHDEIKGHVSVGSKSAGASTLPGLSMVAAASAARARQTASKLKLSSRSSSTRGSDEAAQMIPLKC